MIDEQGNKICNLCRKPTDRAFGLWDVLSCSEACDIGLDDALETGSSFLAKLDENGRVLVPGVGYPEPGFKIECPGCKHTVIVRDGLIEKHSVMGRYNCKASGADYPP